LFQHDPAERGLAFLQRPHCDREVIADLRVDEGLMDPPHDEVALFRRGLRASPEMVVVSLPEVCTWPTVLVFAVGRLRRVRSPDEIERHLALEGPLTAEPSGRTSGGRAPARHQTSDDLCRRRRSSVPSWPVISHEHCDFRPFIATDDGTCLVLLRRRTANNWVLRVIVYTMLLQALALFVVIPYDAWQKYTDFGRIRGFFSAPVPLLICGVAVRLMLGGFRLDGTNRIACKPGDLLLDGRGALLRIREQVQDPVALEARTTKFGNVRWLRLRVRGASGVTDIGYLALDGDAEPAREARVHAAAALMAARLGVPLELRGDQDQQLPT
jgi:hypothetical protein